MNVLGHFITITRHRHMVLKYCFKCGIGNCAFSVKKGTVRGIHFQNEPYAQAKLVRCTKGVVNDYAIDLRKNSPTYLKYVCVELSEENKKQLFIPKGFAHAVINLVDNSEIEYLVDSK